MNVYKYIYLFDLKLWRRLKVVSAMFGSVGANLNLKRVIWD